MTEGTLSLQSCAGLVGALIDIALLTVERFPQCVCAAVGGHDPWTVRPRRIVSNMLVVSALQLGDPVLLLVLVKSDDAPVHSASVAVRESRTTARDDEISGLVTQ